MDNSKVHVLAHYLELTKKEQGKRVPGKAFENLVCWLDVKRVGKVSESDEILVFGSGVKMVMTANVMVVESEGQLMALKTVSLMALK